MVLFGGIMVFLGRRGTSAMKPTTASPEGRAIEELEHRKELKDTTPKENK